MKMPGRRSQKLSAQTDTARQKVSRRAKRAAHAYIKAAAEPRYPSPADIHRLCYLYDHFAEATPEDFIAATHLYPDEVLLHAARVHVSPKELIEVTPPVLAEVNVYLLLREYGASKEEITSVVFGGAKVSYAAHFANVAYYHPARTWTKAHSRYAISIAVSPQSYQEGMELLKAVRDPDVAAALLAADYATSPLPPQTIASAYYTPIDTAREPHQTFIELRDALARAAAEHEDFLPNLIAIGTSDPASGPDRDVRSAASLAYALTRAADPKITALACVLYPTFEQLRPNTVLDRFGANKDIPQLIALATALA